MKRRLVALLMALAMLTGLLTGCNSDTKEEAAADAEQAQTEETATEAEDSEAEETVALTDEMRADPVAYITDGAIHMDDTVMTVNDTDVPAGVFFYLLSSQYYQAASFYSNYGMTLDLDEVLEDGTSAADALFSYAQGDAERYVLLHSEGDKLNLNFTDEQKQQVEDMMSYVDDNTLLFYLSNREAMDYITRSSMYASGVQDYYFGENGTEAPSDATLEDYAAEHGNYTCRYILLRTDAIEEGDEQGKAEKQSKAQELYDQLSAFGGDELETKFAELQAEFNEDGNIEPFSFDENSSLVEGFREKLAEMKPGELGLTEETDYGYFVVLRLDTDLDTVRDSYTSERLSTMMDQWAEAAAVTVSDAVNNLDKKATLEKIHSIQDAVIDQMNAEIDAAANEDSEGFDAEEFPDQEVGEVTDADDMNEVPEDADQGN